jgi:hypothetical protein
VPLYLVRWPDLSAALVKAANEDALLGVLDEIANPEGCTWSVYRGPLFIELKLNAEIEDAGGERRDRPIRPEDLRIGDVTRICGRDPLTAEIPEYSDTAHEMKDAILRGAFPAVHAALDREGETVSEPAVRAALRDELEVLVRASWRQEQTKRRSDEDSRIAAMLGTSPRLVRSWGDPGKSPPAEPPGPGGGARRPRRPRVRK